MDVAVAEGAPKRHVGEGADARGVDTSTVPQEARGVAPAGTQADATVLHAHGVAGLDLCAEGQAGHTGGLARARSGTTAP